MYASTHTTQMNNHEEARWQAVFGEEIRTPPVRFQSLVDSRSLGSKSSLLPVPPLNVTVAGAGGIKASGSDEDARVLVATTSYVAQHDDEMTVKQGDEVHGWKDPHNDQWLKARNVETGRVGFVPEMYFEDKDGSSGMGKAASTPMMREASSAAREATSTGKDAALKELLAKRAAAAE